MGCYLIWMRFRFTLLFRETRVLAFLCFRGWKRFRVIRFILVRLVWLIPSKLEKGFRLLATPRILTGRSIMDT